MSARSMTGFARVRRACSGSEATVSLKSLNHRGLDLHFHMPPVLDAFEPLARAAIKKRVDRGHVQVHVSLERVSLQRGRDGAHDGRSALNRELLQSWAEAFREAAGILDSPAPPDPNAALRVPGMLQGHVAREGPLESPEAYEPLMNLLTEGLEEALDELNAFREREGRAIAEEMQGRVRSVEELARCMEELRSTATEAFHRRLRDKLTELLGGGEMDPHRLAQEAAILAERSDISEEIMRLKTHAEQVAVILEGSGEKGKKLDFLLQEMNRESNTILSKTGGLGECGLTLTDLALRAKGEIDKMREQALNLE